MANARELTLYERLLASAERALSRPALLAADDELAAAQMLHAEVRAAVERLSAPQLMFEEEVLLADVLVKMVRARRDHDEERLKLFAQVAGVLTPAVREHAGWALRVTPLQRPATSDQDYHRIKR